MWIGGCVLDLGSTPGRSYSFSPPIQTIKIVSRSQHFQTFSSRNLAWILTNGDNSLGKKFIEK